VSNPFAANFGDVVKHAVLCAVLELERPGRYLESHGGQLVYDLRGRDPGPGGVWDFLEEVDADDTLRDASYARLARAAAGSRAEPGAYLGSIALADAVLPPGHEIVAWELVDDSAASLRDGLERRGRPATVAVGDGLDGVCRAGRAGDLVLIDPFEVHARGTSVDAVGAFIDVGTRGISALLWYPIHDPGASDGWIGDAGIAIGGGLWHERLVGRTVQSGLAGCGYLGANLKPESEATASRIVQSLASRLASVRPGLRRR
jgi:23S rRNA A2030 N6-methylase RlmJ